jgi:uncharacterized protein
MTQLRLILKAPALWVSFCFWLLLWQLNAQIRDGRGESDSVEHRCGDTLQATGGGPTNRALQMRKRGIKAVDADASFVWNHGVESVSITNLSYYSAYSGMGSKLLDTPPSADAFSKELAVEAGPVLTEELQELVPTELAKLRLMRARGSIVVTLFDDPCIPVKGTLGPIEDPDLSPLIVVSSSHSLAAFNALLKEGADVNAHDQKGLTPLMAASFAGNVEMVKSLVERGARVNDQDIDGRTALHHASGQLRASSVIPVLVKAGADINLKLSPTAEHLAGATPLIIAAAMGNAQAVRLLVAAGADQNALTWDRMTALDVARHPPIFTRQGHSEVIELLERATRQKAISNPE